MATAPGFTSMGSPCAQSWDEEWVKLVGAEERSLGKRICGARLRNGEPCRAQPKHGNGRCPYHGGNGESGAPARNRNAVVHGLYVRGVQRCGEHCPMWKHCPMAQKEILKMPEKWRPECPYELQYVDAAVGEGGGNIEEAPEEVQLHVLSKVMMLRAAAAMSVSPLWTSDKEGNAVKVHPAVDAYRRLSGECRRHSAERTRKERLATHLCGDASVGKLEGTERGRKKGDGAGKEEEEGVDWLAGKSEMDPEELRAACEAEMGRLNTALEETRTVVGRLEAHLKLERQVLGGSSQVTRSQLGRERRAMLDLERQLRRLGHEMGIAGMLGAGEEAGAEAGAGIEGGEGTEVAAQDVVLENPP